MGTDADIASIRWCTRRLVLRSLAEPDRAEFVRLHRISEEHLRPWSPAVPDGLGHDELFDAALERTREGTAAGTSVRFAAFVRDDPSEPEPTRFVGTFNLNNIVRGVFLNADAGWMVGADVLGRGYATEGVTALLDLAFTPGEEGGLGLHRVQANIIPANTRSLRVAVKAGFREEGCARAMLRIAGEWQDHLMFAKLADEHRARIQGAMPASESSSST
jgi:ribosomal-protein-alanine N-acetyltransferase